jgi:hypothetical protein
MEGYSTLAATSAKAFEPSGTRVITEPAAVAKHRTEPMRGESGCSQNTATPVWRLLQIGGLDARPYPGKRFFNLVRLHCNGGPAITKCRNWAELGGFVLNAPLSSAIWH